MAVASTKDIADAHERLNMIFARAGIVEDGRSVVTYDRSERFTLSMRRSTKERINELVPHGERSRFIEVAILNILEVLEFGYTKAVLDVTSVAVEPLTMGKISRLLNSGQRDINEAKALLDTVIREGSTCIKKSSVPRSEP